MTARAQSDMLALTEALYRADSARMQALLAEEARLRSDLNQIADMRRAAREMPDGHLSEYRAAGADLLWQGWIGQSKARIHAELARVLGRKGQVSRELRRSFGKYHAAAQIAAEQARRTAQRREAIRFGQLDSIAQLQRMRSD
ncbi:MAG: hypothetical protein ACNA7M_02185 [Roseovarius sp.]